MFNPFTYLNGSPETESAPSGENVSEGQTVGQALGAGNVVGQSTLEVTGKLRIGLKLKVTIIVLLSVILVGTISSVLMQVIRPTVSGIREIVRERIQTPALDHDERNREVPGFSVWQRSKASDDGFPYHDKTIVGAMFGTQEGTRKEEPNPTKDAFLKRVTRRQTQEDATTTTQGGAVAENVTPPPPATLTSASDDQAVEIEFHSFGCNIVDRFWLCSKSNSQFCIFFNKAVPASKRIYGVPVLVPLKPNLPSGKRLMEYRCRNKIQLFFRGTSKPGTE